MTLDEAKLVLDNARPQTKEIDRQFYDDEDLNNALDMAIKALEQQPSDDCVSREFIGVKVEYQPEDLCTYPEYKGKPYFSIVYRENDEEIIGYGTYKPEVLTDYLKRYFMPTFSEDCVSRAEVTDELNRLGRNAFKDDTDYDNFFAFVDSLPPVTPTHGTCKECKYSSVHTISLDKIDEIRVCRIQFSKQIKDDYYCANFEKRGDESER